MLDRKKVYLLLGSNLGERTALLQQAAERIEKEVGEIFAMSSMYETAAWGMENQPTFINVALGVRTVFPALEVLDKVLKIEEQLGRIRHEKWGARLIDIDLIFYGDEIIQADKTLQIPHPEMHKRRFVLEPLTEIAPEVIHPVFELQVQELLQKLKDNLSVSKI